MFGGSLWYALMLDACLFRLSHIFQVFLMISTLENGCRSTTLTHPQQKPMLSHNAWMNCILTTHILAKSKTRNIIHSFSIKHQVSINQSRQTFQLWLKPLQTNGCIPENHSHVENEHHLPSTSNFSFQNLSFSPKATFSKTASEAAKSSNLGPPDGSIRSGF